MVKNVFSDKDDIWCLAVLAVFAVLDDANTINPKKINIETTANIHGIWKVFGSLVHGTLTLKPSSTAVVVFGIFSGGARK
jgi:hypothetical protein